MGLYHTFERFASEEAQSAYKIDPYAVDHPVGQDRLADIQNRASMPRLSATSRIRRK